MEYVSRTALVTTPIETIESLFGPVLPGTSTPERTISVFRNRFSKRNYQMFGQVGIHEDALFYVHTQIAIDLTKVKSNITGISDEATAVNENKERRIKEWIAESSVA